MIKATLKHKNIRTKTEEIELPDAVNTGDIICVITEAIRNFDYGFHKVFDKFEIALENGKVYYCYEVVPNKYRLYVYYIDDEGEEYDLLADFKF